VTDLVPGHADARLEGDAQVHGLAAVAVAARKDLQVASDQQRDS
jgi:hypothetical protein